MPDIRTPGGREKLRRMTRKHGDSWWRKEALDGADGLDIAQEMRGWFSGRTLPADLSRLLAEWDKWKGK